MTLHSLASPVALRLSLSAALFASPGQAFAQDTAAAGPYAGLQRTVAEVMRSSGTPGVAVVVVRGERVDFARGFGVADVETGAPMRTDLLAQIGSVTKPMTAALVLTLAHEGWLDAAAPARRYVEGLAPRLAGIPLGRLLSQSSGLAEMPGDDGTREESQLLAFARTLGDTLAMLSPGTSFSYSNLNFSLAGLAAQEAADTPFADLLDARLLQPPGMRRTTGAGALEGPASSAPSPAPPSAPDPRETQITGGAFDVPLHALP